MAIKKKPSLQKNSRYKTGLFLPKNINKYIGSTQNIIFRSEYELIFFRELDCDPMVIRWKSEPEEICIKYMCSTKKKVRTYFPDVYVEKMIGGVLKKLIVEIKPKTKLKAPKLPSNNVADRTKAMKTYRYNMLEFLNIIDKKKYADSFAKSRGMEYIFITEDTIKPLKKVHKTM